MVRMNGRMVLEEPIPVLITAPAQVRIGASGIEPAITQRGFTGRIEVLERVVGENRPSVAPSAPTQ